MEEEMMIDLLSSNSKMLKMLKMLLTGIKQFSNALFLVKHLQRACLPVLCADFIIFPPCWDFELKS